MDPNLLAQLRADLNAADYRSAAITALLGAAADAARTRGNRVAARHALAARQVTPLALLVRLWIIGEALTTAELALALPHLGADGAVQLGLVRGEGDGALPGAAVRFVAALSLNPVQLASQHWWIISDLDDHLRQGPAAPDHVMGVAGATRSLLAQLPQEPHDGALDLGTGCGIVALVLAQLGPVVATEISERAVRLARANAQLNEVAGIEFRIGSLFAPVAGERFALIASNPPFVITPREASDVPRYDYRDGGMTGDTLAATVVREAPQYLQPGGTLLCLANWESPWGENGLHRVTEWIEAAALEADAPLTAWVVERDRVLPAQYAETWARDGGARPGDAAYDALLESWLNDFERRRITAIGLGAIRVQRLAQGSVSARVRSEAITGAYAATGLAARLAACYAAGHWAQTLPDAALLQTRWCVAPEVVEVREHQPGIEHPRAIELRIDTPFERRTAADAFLAAAVGACDGELTLGQIADALATLLELDPAAAQEALCDGVRELAWLGMLAPADRIDA